MALRFVILVLAIAALSTTNAGAGLEAADGCGLAGAFRNTYGRIVYDAGGRGAGTLNLSSRQLVLTGSGWSFGSSSGSWRAAAITAADWTRWRSKPYGPTRKIVLAGWNRATADGPIDERGGVIASFWVMYHVGPPTVGAPAWIQLRFGPAQPTGCGPGTSPGETPDSTGGANVVVTPTTIRRGETAQVTASGFEPGERLLLTDEHGGTVDYLSGGNADERGTLAFTRPTLSTTAAGPHKICAEGPSSHRKACGTFTVKP